MKRLIWDSVLDDRTCEACLALHGVDVTELPYTRPPCHIKDDMHLDDCRCVIVEVEEE